MRRFPDPFSPLRPVSVRLPCCHAVCGCEVSLKCSVHNQPAWFRAQLACAKVTLLGAVGAKFKFPAEAYEARKHQAACPSGHADGAHENMVRRRFQAADMLPYGRMTAPVSRVSMLRSGDRGLMCTHRASNAESSLDTALWWRFLGYPSAD